MQNKIVFVTPSLKTGGGNRVFIELSNQMAGKHDVLILAPNNFIDRHTFELNRKISIYIIGNLAICKFSKIANIIKTIIYINKKHKNDVIIVSDPIISIFMFIINSKCKYRFLQSDDYRIYDDGFILGTGIVLKLFKFITKLSYRQKNIYLFNSMFTYKNFIDVSARMDIKCNIVHPAIDPDIFNMTNLFRTTKLVITLVARKHPMKGLNTFINVWNELTIIHKEIISEVILVSHDDLSSYNINGMKIVSPSSDQELALIYKKTDIFISTSWHEGFGLPPLEAMACGCACIISNSGGVNEFVNNGINCLLFEPKNENELKSKLLRLINDPKLRVRLSEQAFIDAHEFTWDKSKNQLMKIIKQ